LKEKDVDVPIPKFTPESNGFLRPTSFKGKELKAEQNPSTFGRKSARKMPTPKKPGMWW